MAASSLRATLVGAVDGLLSIHSTPTAHDAALRHVERVVASVSLDPANALFDAFLRFQDDCCLNVTAVLVEWLARTLATQATALAGDIDEQCRPNLVRCLRLFQGLLLLHRPSQRFFARRSSLECLLAVLDLTRPSLPPSPLPSSPQPFPSPVLFPPTPLSSPSLGQASSHTPPNSAANTQLALAALDALLCALVDRPKNLRVFEDIGGLTIIVKVLKDKSVAQPVRIKVIELLYFYLLPEVNPEEISGPALNASFSSATASASSTLDSRVLAESNTLPALFASAADFVPQTPESSGAAADAASMPPPPAPLPRAGLTRSRPSTGLERRASVGPAGLGRSTSAGSRSASSYTSPSSSSSAARAHKVPPTPARERHTRTEGEKKELLRRLMPNVDALEQRFRAMGLGLG
ncbi:hypothetical protein JCM3770_002659 [Rhodotorula araucariae]